MKKSVAARILQSNREVHRREAEIYDAIHPELFGRFEQRRIARDIDLIASVVGQGPELCVLDVGCGTGNLALKFLGLGCRVKAVDISPEMLGRLCSKADPRDSERLEVVEGDAKEILSAAETHGTYDIISFSSVLHHLPDYKVVLAHALRQLRSGGVLYVSYEPLPRTGTGSPRDPSPLLASILRRIDGLYILARKLLVYVVHSLKLRAPFGRIDYSWSDYHLRTGIDAQEVLLQLQSQGARTLYYETYRNYYTALLTWLDHHCQLSAPTQFRFIVQRADNP